MVNGKERKSIGLALVIGSSPSVILLLTEIEGSAEGM